MKEKATPGRKRGYRKQNAMAGRIAMRVPQELVDWLDEEGARLGLGVGDMARMYLLERMHATKESD